MSKNVELHLTVDRMLNGIPATCQHANFMCVISSLIMPLQYVMGKLHSRELSNLHIQHSSVMVLFSLNFSADFSQSLVCCTQGCGVTSRLVRLGAMGRDRPPWNGQQCLTCWELLNSASAESLETHQENSDRCLKWKKQYEAEGCSREPPPPRQSDRAGRSPERECQDADAAGQFSPASSCFSPDSEPGDDRNEEWREVQDVDAMALVSPASSCYGPDSEPRERSASISMSSEI